MRKNQLAICSVERCVARGRALKELDCLQEVLVLECARAGRQEESFGPAVLIEGDKISRRSLLDGFLLVRRKLRLQLLRNGFGDLALDREDIGQIAIISLRPHIRVIARVDQLRIHPHAIGRALHAPF
jgi:hypothetical protein